MNTLVEIFIWLYLIVGIIVVTAGIMALFLNLIVYAYNLTRVKEARQYGTLTIDDFEEFTEETIDDIVEFVYKENSNE